MSYYPLTTAETLKKIDVNDKGLSDARVRSQRELHGKNELVETDKISPFKILVEQFASFLVFLLFGAAILSYLIGEHIDALVILGVLIINAAVGFIQEYKAEEALSKLQSMETLFTLVIRDDEEQEIDSVDLVPGDIVLLKEGDRIPADGRLLDTLNLEVDESMLTGESRAVCKNTKELPEKTPLAERFNMVYSGTIVTKGKGKYVVTEIGMETEFGSIAKLVQKVESTSTPLQLTLDKLGHTLGLVSIGLALPGLALGIYKGRDITEIAMTSVALAVSAIPEGLPIVVTVALAFGVKRMVKKHVLIRKLSAVEALGSTNIICTDKTGTITQNKMEVSHIFTFDLGFKAFKGNISLIKKNEKQLIESAIICNDATLKIGDPTEKALVSFAYDAGQDIKIRRDYPRVNESPFSSENKYMITLNQVGKEKIAYAKGAPEKIIKLSRLTKDQKRRILETVEQMSSQGMRVLGFASRKIKTDTEFTKHSGYSFLGLLGLIDPPRKSVKGAIAKCHKAGIRVIMITGDHPITASSIAHQVGIESDNVVTGHEIDTISDKEFGKIIDHTNIFARVSPEHKLKILSALQKKGHFVAMTGDGVNDAPALKEANIGIAVGSGSDLAKEVADMVILNDDFASIVDAVNEGRGIFSNIKKVVTFLIAVNFDEILILMASIFFSLPLPLMPIHLLWLNLATDTLPSLALSVDPYAKNLMDRLPYDPRREITRGVLGFSILAGLLAFIASFSIFLIEIFIFKSSLVRAQTMTFTVTVLFELFFIFVVRTNKRIKDSAPFSNRWLLIAVGIGLLLQMLAVYGPYANRIFKTVPLSPLDFIMMLPFAFFGVIVFEFIRFCKCNFFGKELGNSVVKSK
ncbi:MAG: cation-translocating P-type ATPase [Candidatus Pacebacteria bacterium]|nr:cation-translocating P-type ATPase [Candidatus Paceibacterota bacterium]